MEAEGAMTKDGVLRRRQRHQFIKKFYTCLSGFPVAFLSYDVYPDLGINIGLMADPGPDRYTWQQAGQVTEDSQYLSWEEMMNRERVYSLQIAKNTLRLHERPTWSSLCHDRLVANDRSDPQSSLSIYEVHGILRVVKHSMTLHVTRI